MRTYRYFEWKTAPGGQLSGDQLMDTLSDYCLLYTSDAADERMVV